MLHFRGMPQPRNPDPGPPVPPADEPEWARSLREVIEQLPGKLNATITDDDRRGIAEYVHGLFEQSGAFQRPPEPEPEPPGPEPEPDTPPHKPSLAERMFGTGCE